MSSSLDDLVEEDFTSSEELFSTLSEGDLKTFFRCPYSYYLKKHLGPTKIPRPASFGQLLFFQHARRALFNLRDSQIGRLFPYQTRAGRELKLAEEMSSEELQTYLASSSRESFGRFLFGRWLLIAKKDFYAGAPLVWSFSQQPFLAARQLQSAGENYYRFILKQGAPVLGFVNKTIYFKFEGTSLALKFPEIRKKGIIDDPTLWNFNEDFPDSYENTKNNLSTSSLVTLRILAFCNLAYNIPHYRRKWGLSEEIVEGWKPPYLDEKVCYRHFNATQNQLSETSRSLLHLDPLKKALDYFFEQTAKENFPPKLKSCSSCSYNVLGLDGEIICSKRKKGGKPLVPSYYFKKKSFIIDVKKDNQTLTLTGLIQKNEKVAKIVSQYCLSFSETEGATRVTSGYSSSVRGLGFEERILTEADQQLQKIADNSQKPVAHQINFERDFQFAGQKKIRETLQQLGYQQDKKEYLPSA